MGGRDSSGGKEAACRSPENAERNEEEDATGGVLLGSKKWTRRERETAPETDYNTAKMNAEQFLQSAGTHAGEERLFSPVVAAVHKEMTGIAVARRRPAGGKRTDERR